MRACMCAFLSVFHKRTKRCSALARVCIICDIPVAGHLVRSSVGNLHLAVFGCRAAPDVAPAGDVGIGRAPVIDRLAPPPLPPPVRVGSTGALDNVQFCGV